MSRSPLWFASFALAERQNRCAIVWVEPEPGSDVAPPIPRPATPAEIGRMSGAEADACEAAYLAAFDEAP